MNGISKKISDHLSSWNVMSYLVEAYSAKSAQMWKQAVNLRENLAKVVKRDWDQSMEKGKQYHYWSLFVFEKYLC